MQFNYKRQKVAHSQAFPEKGNVCSPLHPLLQVSTEGSQAGVSPFVWALGTQCSFVHKCAYVELGLILSTHQMYSWCFKLGTLKAWT